MDKVITLSVNDSAENYSAVIGVDLVRAVFPLHRVRQDFVKEPTAAINRNYGLMSEFGVALPLRTKAIDKKALNITCHFRGRNAGEVRDFLQHLSTGVDVFV